MIHEQIGHRAESRTTIHRGWFAGYLLVAICFVIGLLEPYGQPRLKSPSSLVEFSSNGAMRHISALAQYPRPSGSEPNRAARRYIARQLELLGLTATEAPADILRDAGHGNYFSGHVTNVISVLKGTTTDKPIVLEAHYDSVFQGPGASDNAQGVAVLLETARAIKAGPSLRRDLIFVFSDGHENGLLGAEAFAHFDVLARMRS